MAEAGDGRTRTGAGMKISIAIPTRERAEFLGASLATCTAIDDPELEIIVSDNASADDTARVVAAAGDRRVRYVNTGARLSMRQNFEFAVAQSTGDYVMLMGDDDGMLPRQFGLLKSILLKHRPPVLASRPLYYLWPSPKATDMGGRLKIARQGLFGGLSRQVSAGLIEKVRDDRLDRNDFLPMIYHGMVRRDVVETVRERTGAVFSCSVPDVYFYISALAMLDEFKAIEHPFSIQGIGTKSTGVDARQGTDDGESPAERFAREAATDPIVDPIPGRLPAIEMYYLNAVEQANRVAFGGTLAPNYGAYLNRVGAALIAAGPEKLAEGLPMLQRFVAGLAEPGDAVAVLARLDVAAAAAPAGAALAGRRRWMLPSYASGGKVVVDLKRLSSGSIADAASHADMMLGQGALGDDDRALGSWGGVLARALPLIARSLISTERAG